MAVKIGLPLPRLRQVAATIKRPGFRYLNFGLIWLILAGCNVEEGNQAPPPKVTLKIVATYKLAIPEPSGIAFGENNAVLWIVSDQTGNLYQTTLTGKILRTLDLQANDLEGVSYNRITSELLVVEEYTTNVIRLDTLGNIQSQFQILNTHDNSGLEGICTNGAGQIFVVKEKNPGLWLALNPDFSINTRKELTFAADYADLVSDVLENRFWIISDQDQIIFLWDQNQGVLEKYEIPIANPEGIAYDAPRQLFYVVSDSEEKLYVLSK
ncbi:SdiA-regulated domain-containing protein [candidate division KSB1 bacterium]|nr:SdiA-regulated domain-containing protein [candidate division KSB1 bacterium]